MVHVRTVLWGSGMHGGRIYLKGTKGVTKGKSCTFFIKTAVNLSATVPYHIPELGCSAENTWILFLPSWGSPCHTLAANCTMLTHPALHRTWIGHPELDGAHNSEGQSMIFPSCPEQFTGYLLALAQNANDTPPLVDPGMSANVKTTHFKFNLLEPICNQAKSLYGL